MSKSEVYFSIDIETDGPAPGINSMLALGAVAYSEDGTELGTWYRTLMPLDNAVRNIDTMEWWRTQPDAWEEVSKSRWQPGNAIMQFVDWVDDVRNHCKAIAVAWPAAFDFGFVNWYCHRFAGVNPLGFACLDIRSYANGLFGVPGYYEKIPEGNLYDMFGVQTEDLRSHVAVDDAIRQGRLFMALLKLARERAE